MAGPLKSRTHLTRPSQLAEQITGELVGSHTLVFCPPADDFCLSLSRQLPDDPLTVFSLDYAAHRSMRASFQAEPGNSTQLLFGPAYTPESRPHKSALVFLPKGRELVEMSLQMVAACLQPGGRLFLVGENSSGIRSHKDRLKRLVGPIQRSATARHSVLYQAKLAVDPPPFNLKAWAGSYRLRVRAEELTVISFPGVFSHGKVDEGTRLLVESLTASPQTKILDFGCGSGVIGAAALKIYPGAGVDLVDSNALALEASRRTLAANQMASARVSPSDVFSDVGSTYSLILSNPPFHSGVRTEYRVVSDFIQQSIQHLDTGGSLRLVANRFLKYQPLLEGAFSNCRVVAEDSRYKVYESVREK